MTALVRMAIALAASLLSLSPAAAAAPCMSDQSAAEIVTGKLSIKRAKDAAGRPERPYIVTLAAPVCLSAQDPQDNVAATSTVHVYTMQAGMAAQMARLVGRTVVVRGKPFPAHTAHHHAPIVMEIGSIEAK